MSPGDAILLDHAEAMLRQHSPATFDRPDDFGFPECIEAVRGVEDTEAWKARYPSLDAFHAAHETRHPDIRVYGEERRAILTENTLTSPGGLPSERLARRRQASQG